MQIQLLSPAGEIHRSGTGIFKTSLRYAPLTLTTLDAMVPPELNAEVTIQDEGVQPLDLDADADLVGITAITGTVMMKSGSFSRINQVEVAGAPRGSLESPGRQRSRGQKSSSSKAAGNVTREAFVRSPTPSPSATNRYRPRDGRAAYRT